MTLSDRHNWILSGAVGALLVANGIARLPGSTGTLDLVLAGALVVGGLLAASNAVSAIRDPSAVEDVEWSRNKTLLNAGAVVLLTLALVAVLYPLLV
jgi:hypothetical protein